MRNTEVTALLTAMAADPWGRVSPSVYETARLITLAPWLEGHRRRIRFIVDNQHPNGRWGGPAEYGLVPTLSAVEALLRQGGGDVANRGVAALFRWLNSGSRVTLPDTVAVELIVPALVEDINALLGEGPKLRSPVDPTPLHRLRAAPSLPAKLWHSLEVLGHRPDVLPVRGAVACSPAATAAWLGERRHGPSLRYLRAVQSSWAGPVPVGVPVTLFEHAWVLIALHTAGIRFPTPHRLIAGLHGAFSPGGASGGPGLPPDADDTATALHALDLFGSPRSTDILRQFRVGAHFACYPDERTPSTSTNAHVLQVLGTDRALADWLRDCQEHDGSWSDKWHASPYYATACCVAALGESEPAVDWVLGTQRADGSWGRWDGTYEETSYAVQTLLRARTSRPVWHAAARGCEFLRTWGDREHPPLWHDKDLYTPARVVRAEGLAALHLARSSSVVAYAGAR
jgi:hypothetical protein